MNSIYLNTISNDGHYITQLTIFDIFMLGMLDIFTVITIDRCCDEYFNNIWYILCTVST